MGILLQSKWTVLTGVAFLLLLVLGMGEVWGQVTIAPLPKQLNVLTDPNAPKVKKNDTTKVMILRSSATAVQCNNLGFESGDFTNWSWQDVTDQGGVNTSFKINSSGSATNIAPVVGPVNSKVDECYDFTLLTAASINDPYGNFSVANPIGGTYTVRIGGDAENSVDYGFYDDQTYGCTVPQAHGQDLYQTFNVGKSNAIFTYAYAVVLNTAPENHSQAQAAYFRLQITNSLGDTISCLQFSQYGTGTGVVPGFTKATGTPNSNSGNTGEVCFKPWTINMINLSAYIGSTVTVKVSAGGCYTGAHFGYAYFASKCGAEPLLSIPAASCAGGNTTITAPTGGTSYSWAQVPSTGGIVSGGNTNVVTVNASGKYVVTIGTAGTSCNTTYTLDTTITVSGGSSNPPTMSAVSPTCFGLSTGTATATPSSGSAPYTYSWSNGATAQTISNVAAGTYSVTVTTSAGCTSSNTVTVSPTPQLTVSPTAVNETCGNSNGSVVASASGGTGAYTYSWSTGATAQTITGLSANSYTVTITDANGCKASNPATVAGPSALSATSPTPTNASCGKANGSAWVVASGGTAAYTYSWSNGATAPTITNVAAGTYTVTVTDKNGCTQQQSPVIGGSPAEALSAPTPTSVKCFGASTGSAVANVSTGTAPYTYSWSNGATAQTATGLAASTTYSVTITDANGCSSNTTVSLTAPQALTVPLTPVNASCGKTNGSVSVAATGGTGAYTYSWSTGATAATITGLGAGGYSVTVTDANGCTKNANTTVQTPASFTLTAPTPTNLKCNGYTNGSAFVATPSGGASPYTYSWSNGATGQTATGLSAATYSVTVTDANGCLSASSTTLTAPTAIAATPTATSTACGKTNGSIALSVSGGTPGYTYSWSNAASGQTVTGLGAGSYTVTVTDNNGCKQTTSAAVSSPSGITSVTAAAVNATCHGLTGSASVTLTGGTAPFTYSWSNGATAQTVSGLAASATYSVTVTDANGCAINAATTVTQPSAIAINFGTPTLASCNNANGSVSATASGGSGSNYTYSWSAGGTGPTASNLAAATYTLTVTDGSGCINSNTTTIGSAAGYTIQPPQITNVKCFGANTGSAVVQISAGGTGPFTYTWSNGTTGATGTNLAAATYTVTVTDGNGCSSAAPVQITAPQQLSALVSPLPTTCGKANGSASATASGGVTSYTFSWSSGATGTTVNALAAGTYSLSLTDANGCTTTPIPVVIGSSTNPQLQAAVTTNVLCNGQNGSVAATVTGGTAAYTYSWSNGTTATTSSLNNTLTTAAGTYTISVTDAAGCTNSASVQLKEPTAVVISSVSPTPASCGLSNGAVSAAASGGTGTLTYSWSNGNTGASLTALAPGTYTVTVTDANGCSPTPASTTVANNSSLQATAGPVSTICAGDTVKLSSSGGATYAWTPVTALSNPGIAAPLAFPTTSITYSVTVSNGNTCSGTSTVAITVNPMPTNPTVSSYQSIVQGSSVQLSATGGSSYTWTPPTGLDNPLAENPNASPTVTTLYSVLISTAQGCKVTDTVTVFVTPDICNGKNIFVPNAFSPNGDNENDRLAVRGECLSAVHFQVFDRWGECVFDSTDMNASWDGTYNGQPMNDGVYIWVVDASFTTGDRVKLKGNVTLLR